MTESEFIQLTDTVLLRIENAFDDCASDIEFSSNGSVLEIEFEDGTKVIVNRHVPNREIWVAAKSGGFHYSFEDGRWLSKRDGSELFSKLGELVLIATNEAIVF